MLAFSVFLFSLIYTSGFDVQQSTENFLIILPWLWCCLVLSSCCRDPMNVRWQSSPYPPPWPSLHDFQIILPCVSCLHGYPVSCWISKPGELPGCFCGPTLRLHSLSWVSCRFMNYTITLSKVYSYLRLVFQASQSWDMWNIIQMKLNSWPSLPEAYPCSLLISMGSNLIIPIALIKKIWVILYYSLHILPVNQVAPSSENTQNLTTSPTASIVT